MTPLQIGNIAGIIALIVFAALWILIIRKNTVGIPVGTWMNAAGFGLLPCIAVWKAFESGFFSDSGGERFDDFIHRFLGVYENGRFLPARIEMLAAAVAFFAVTGWLMLRKNDLPGNGDLLLTVLCIWGLIRSVTENLRVNTLRTGIFSFVILLAFCTELICLLIWSVRRRRKQKNPGLTAIEWAAVTGCGVLLAVQNAGMIALRSETANLAAAAGCAIVMGTLILSAGKDSRET